MWKQVEVWVCDFCESEHCSGECQTPKVVKPLPDRIEKYQMKIEATGIMWDFRCEWRGDEVTVIGPYLDVPLIGNPLT